MATWTCPNCDRTFGQKGRGHICKPGITVDEYLSEALPITGPIHERILDHVTTLDGDLIVDPLDAGIMYKHDAMFAMITSKTKWVALTVQLPRKLESGRVSRKVVDYGNLFSHVFNLTDPDQIDDEMCDWLTEAFFRRTPGMGPGDEASPSSDPMVPDDVDLGPLG